MSTATVVLAILAIIFTGCSDPQLEKELRLQDEQYCEMVKLWRDTDGQNGWADYNGNYEEVCDET